MTWDVTKPLDAGPIRTGDDYIRELKADLEMAISEEHSFPVDGGDPHGYHNIPAGTTAERPVGATGQWYYNTTLGTIQRYSGTAWVDLTESECIVSGTAMIFCQTTAPTGWTRKTSINDYMLRAVIGTSGGTTGGAWGVTIAAADHSHDHSGITSSTTPTLNHDGANSISGSATAGNYFYGAGSITHNESTAHTHSITSDTFNHGHTILNTWRPKYKDVIIAEKD